MRSTVAISCALVTFRLRSSAAELLIKQTAQVPAATQNTYFFIESILCQGTRMASFAQSRKRHPNPRLSVDAKKSFRLGPPRPPFSTPDSKIHALGRNNHCNYLNNRHFLRPAFYSAGSPIASALLPSRPVPLTPCSMSRASATQILAILSASV